MKSILQLAQLYRDFLDGESMIPTYTQPLIGLVGDTKEQLSTIKKLNDLSFLTNDSQDGLEETTPLVTTYQRSYIDGFMPTIIAELMRQDLALSDILFFSKPIDSSKFICKLYDDYEINDGIYRIPVTVQRFPNGDQKLHSNFHCLVDCNSFKSITLFLEKHNPDLKEVFFKNFSFVSCVDPVWKRPKYLAEVITTRLEKVIQTLSVTWEESCSIFTSFDNDKLIHSIKTAYPELKIDEIESLTKTELCLILSLAEIRGMIQKDGISGLKQIGENFKKHNKEAVAEWMNNPAEIEFTVHNETIVNHNTLKAELRQKLKNEFSEEELEFIIEKFDKNREELMKDVIENEDLDLDKKIQVVKDKTKEYADTIRNDFFTRMTRNYFIFLDDELEKLNLDIAIFYNKWLDLIEKSLKLNATNNQKIQYIKDGLFNEYNKIKSSS